MADQVQKQSSDDASVKSELLRLTTGYWVSQAIHAAATLGIADLLRDGSQSSQALAAASGADASSLYRLMRALASVGVFRETAPDCFGLTPIAELLQDGVPGSMRGWAVMLGEEWFCRPWRELLHSVRTGKPAFDHVYGMGTFEYFGTHSEAAAAFHEAMTSLSAAENAALVAGYDFSALHKIVDVAGGHGSLLIGILRANPHLRGLLFDRPVIVEEAGRRIESEGLAGRCESVGGDFFDSVPAGADGYILKHIIHDWDDERVMRILGNCRRAMAPGSRLLVVETVIPPGDTPSFGKLLDLNMLVRTGGRERTEAEYEALFAAAGFELIRVMPTPTPVCVIEAAPACT